MLLEKGGCPPNSPVTDVADGGGETADVVYRWLLLPFDDVSCGPPPVEDVVVLELAGRRTSSTRDVLLLGTGLPLPPPLAIRAASSRRPFVVV
jgi:hypothetical protein